MTPALREILLSPTSINSLTRQISDMYRSTPGFMLDFTNRRMLFQNSDGSGRVSNANDPIGYAKDLSGNGNHATQATGAARPIYATGNSRAMCTGSQFLVTPSIDLSATPTATVVVSFMSGSRTGLMSVFGSGAVANAAGSVVGYINSSSAFVAAKGTASARSDGATLFLANLPVVMDIQLDISQAALAQELIVSIDGDSSNMVNSLGPLGTGNLGNLAFYIGAGPGGVSEFLTGSIHRIAVIGRTCSAQELALLRQWAALPASVVMAPASVAAGIPGLSYVSLYGQSLAQGETSVPALSLAQPYDSLMFNGGARTNPAVSLGFESLLPLVEATVGTQGETPISGALQMIKQQGVATQYMGGAWGAGGNAIAVLSKPGASYDSLLNTIIFGRRRANAIGSSFKSLAFMWVHGEADVSNASYAANLNTLRGTLDADIKLITKQSDNVWCICDQVAIPTIAGYQFAAQQTYSNIRIAAPLYFIAASGDTVHRTNAGSKILGAYYGLAYKTLVVDGNAAWKPLYASFDSVGSTVQTLDVVFDSAVGNLVFDTTIVAAQPDNGVYLFDSSNVAQVLNSVVIVAPNTIRITRTAGIPVDGKLRIGFTDATRTTQGGLATNIRDSQGDTVVFDPTGLNYPMHNWALGTETRINRNRLARSDVSSAVAWAPQAVTVATSTDPRGGSTAATMTRTATTEAGVARATVWATSTQQTASVYAKKGTVKWLVIRFDAVANGDSWFDLDLGVTGTIGAGISGSSITLDPSGFYRCSVTATTGASLSPADRLDFRMSNANAVLTGAIGDTLTVWGAQIDVGAMSDYEGKA